MRRSLLLGLLVLAVSVAACSDDEAATTTSATGASADTDADTTTTPAAASDEPGTTETTSPHASAEPPPGVGDEDEGLGDPLVFIAELAPDTEVPGPGDHGATGRIEIESTEMGEWCIDMEVVALSSDVTDSHIHFGTEGRSGDVVIPIGAPTGSDDDTDTWTDVCVSVEEDLANEIVDAPQAFYANIHTTDHPNGAVRGQLEPSSIFDLTLS